MDLSHESITGHQFELNRRGYDPDAVDARLKEIAAAVVSREQQFAELQSVVGSLQAKVQDADESEEALRLTLKAAAHAKQELLSGARDQVKLMEGEAAEKARVAVAEAEARAKAVTVGADTQAAAIKQEASAQARAVAKAALAESEMLVERIEARRRQLAAAESALRTLSDEASPNIEAARAALDVALEQAKQTVADPSTLELAAPDTAPVVVDTAVADDTADEAGEFASAEVAEPPRAEPASEAEPAVSEPAESVSDEAVAIGVTDSSQEHHEAEPQTHFDEGHGEPAEGELAAEQSSAGVEDAPHLEVVAQQESTADISNKVDRLLEELREVT